MVAVAPKQIINSLKSVVASVFKDGVDQILSWPQIDMRGYLTFRFRGGREVYDCEISPDGTIGYVETQRGDSALLGAYFGSIAQYIEDSEYAQGLIESEIIRIDGKKCKVGKSCGNSCVSKGWRCSAQLGLAQKRVVSKIKQEISDKEREKEKRSNAVLAGVGVGLLGVAAIGVGVGMSKPRSPESTKTKDNPKEKAAKKVNNKELEPIISQPQTKGKANTQTPAATKAQAQKTGLNPPVRTKPTPMNVPIPKRSARKLIGKVKRQQQALTAANQQISAGQNMQQSSTKAFQKLGNKLVARGQKKKQQLQPLQPNTQKVGLINIRGGAWKGANRTANPVQAPPSPPAPTTQQGANKKSKQPSMIPPPPLSLDITGTTPKKGQAWITAKQKELREKGLETSQKIGRKFVEVAKNRKEKIQSSLEKERQKLKRNIQEPISKRGGGNLINVRGGAWKGTNRIAKPETPIAQPQNSVIEIPPAQEKQKPTAPDRIVDGVEIATNAIKKTFSQELQDTHKLQISTKEAPSRGVKAAIIEGAKAAQNPIIGGVAGGGFGDLLDGSFDDPVGVIAKTGVSAGAIGITKTIQSLKTPTAKDLTPSVDFATKTIHISEASKHPDLDTIHGFGQYLHRVGMEDTKKAVELEGFINGVIEKSNACKKLSSFASPTNKDQNRKNNAEFLLQKEQVFGRLVTQYTSRKQKLKQKVIGGKAKSGEQWEKDDFDIIEKEMDAMFSKYGWKK